MSLTIPYGAESETSGAADAFFTELKASLLGRTPSLKKKPKSGNAKTSTLFLRAVSCSVTPLISTMMVIKKKEFHVSVHRRRKELLLVYTVLSGVSAVKERC